MSKSGSHRGVSKQIWSSSEDVALARAVSKFGERGWANIAKLLPGRIGKQCRDRWFNHLRPNLKSEAWSEEEDKLLFEAQKLHGNCWAKFATQLFPGRTDLAIKNRFYSTLRKQSRKRYKASESLEEKCKRQKACVLEEKTKQEPEEQFQKGQNSSYESRFSSCSQSFQRQTPNIANSIQLPQTVTTQNMLFWQQLQLQAFFSALQQQNVHNQKLHSPNLLSVFPNQIVGCLNIFQPKPSLLHFSEALSQLKEQAQTSFLPPQQNINLFQTIFQNKN